MTIPFLPGFQNPPAALPALPFGIHLIISSIASRLSFILPSYRFSSSFRPSLCLLLLLLLFSSLFSLYILCLSSLSSRLEERPSFPVSTFPGQGSLYHLKAETPVFLFAPPPDALPCRRQQFYPSSAATYFVSSHSILSPSSSYLSHIRLRIVPWRTDCFSPFSIVLLHAWSYRCQRFCPNQPRPPPAFAHVHSTTTTTTTCGSPSFVSCFF